MPFNLPHLKGAAAAPNFFPDALFFHNCIVLCPGNSAIVQGYIVPRGSLAVVERPMRWRGCCRKLETSINEFEGEMKWKTQKQRLVK